MLKDWENIPVLFSYEDVGKLHFDIPEIVVTLPV